MKRNRLTRQAWAYIRREKAEQRHQSQYKEIEPGVFIKRWGAKTV